MTEVVRNIERNSVKVCQWQITFSLREVETSHSVVYVMVTSIVVASMSIYLNEETFSSIDKVRST